MLPHNFHPQLIFRSPVLSCSKLALSREDFFVFTKERTFKEAIYLASPILHTEMLKWHEGNLTEPKEVEKLQFSLYKYYVRMQSRCTPYGLFAGLGIGEWQEKNKIEFDADLTKSLNRKTRLDMNVLCNLTQELTKQDFIKPYLKFYPNTSIYLVGNSYRYVEYYYKDTRRFHKINKVDFSEYLNYILTECKTGKTHAELSGLLITEDINAEEAGNFVDELISSQLLVNQLEPTVTGNDYFDALVSGLEEIQSVNPNSEVHYIITLLKEVDDLIKANDAAIINQIDSYKQIYLKLKNILPELSETNLFQTDLYKTGVTKSLSTIIQNQLKDTIHFLNKISPESINPKLKEFASRFYERYEDYEIPLLMALDTETGVGYPAKDNNGVNELVEDVFPSGKLTADSDLKWNVLQAHLLRLITDSIKDHKKVVEISEADFKQVDFSEGTQPNTYPVMFSVLNATTGKIDMSGIGGSSAVNLLGRFAGGDESLNSIVKELAEFEQKQFPDKILAEIVHLPESRTGNILARPGFRPYEIPYLAQASVETEFQIKPEDVTLRVRGNTIILFDKRLQKEIIPRLGNAHNFSFNSLPVYRFLCDLQNQYFTKSYIGFNWGVLANQFDFLPRVEYRNAVLSAAKWLLRKHDMEPFRDKNKSSEEKHRLFFKLKERIELPDRFLIAEGDNELLINCSVPLAIDTFIDAIKHANEVSLEEYLFEEEHALIKDTEGNSFTNECIALVFNENNIHKQTPLISKAFKSKQTFSIGSEWLYYKIYSGVKTADHVLTENIKHLTETLLEKGIIDKWFFIRYADPDVHIRLRLHICDLQKYGEVLQLINTELEPLLNMHILSKIQTDTYKRELERYGDSSIELVEHLFYYDSVFVTGMLSLLDAESGGAIRWQVALRSVDAFLDDFKLTPEQKYNLIDSLSTSFFNEHGGKRELKLTLDNKFRTLRSRVEEALNKESDEEKEYYPIIELLNMRSDAGKFIVNNILSLQANNQLQVDLSNLLGSLLHMNLDRLFMGRNRTNEFVVYDLLSRHYKSALARVKSNTKKQAHAAA